MQELKIKSRLINIQKFEVPTYGYVVNTAAEGMVCYLPGMKRDTSVKQWELI
jgi:hypothetical protein